MEQQTRVKKYAHLREIIAQDQEETNFHDALAPFAKRLSSIDDRFSVEDRPTRVKDYKPIHSKERAYEHMFDPSNEDLITNDFLEQFIEEVKNYNIKEGTRSTHETSKNVIASVLNEEETRKPKPKVFNRPLPEISEEVEQLEQSEENGQDEDLINEVLTLLQDQKEKLDEQDVQLDEDWKTKTLQLTQTIETMEMSLENVNKEISRNRMVNFILAMFILGLLFILAYLVYVVFGLQGL